MVLHLCKWIFTVSPVDSQLIVKYSGLFYFFGGMLQIIGSVMEWIIGNTFPCVVFASYGRLRELVRSITCTEILCDRCILAVSRRNVNSVL